MTPQELLIADLKAVEFIEWRKGLRTEIRGGVLMYDVHGYYKWLDEKELIEYYTTHRT